MVTTHGGVTSVFLLYCISFFRFRVGNRYAAFLNTPVQTNSGSIRRLMQSSPESHTGWCSDRYVSFFAFQYLNE